jgi:hypothetical protein
MLIAGVLLMLTIELQLWLVVSAALTGMKNPQRTAVAQPVEMTPAARHGGELR